MQAIRLARGRSMERHFAFWLSIIGYDRRDHSLSHRIYMVYALAFMSLWFFAVFALFASGGKQALLVLNPVDPASAAARLGVWGLVTWGLVLLARYSRTSPLVFSEDDAYLIVQTPVSRRSLALAWFPGDWLEAALPFFIAVVVLGFSLAETRLAARATAADIPMYAMSGLRALVVTALLHAGLLAFLWAFGLLRLRGASDLRWPRAVAVQAIVLVGGGLLATALAGSGLAAVSVGTWRVVLYPLNAGMEAAFGLRPLLAGLLAGLVLMLSGLVALWLAAPRASLSRAAQETAGREARTTAMRFGSLELASSLALKQRLGMGRAPTRLPWQPGGMSFLWKEGLQVHRSFSPGSLAPWLALAGAAAAIAWLPGWPARGLGLILWVIQFAQLAGLRLQRDMANWWLLGQMPVTARSFIFLESIAAIAAGCLLTWLVSFPASYFFKLNPAWYLPALVLLLPFVAAGVAWMAAYNIARQSRSTDLLAGYAGELNAAGVALGLLCAGGPLIVAWLIGSRLDLAWALLAALVVAAGLALMAWRMAAQAIRTID